MRDRWGWVFLKEEIDREMEIESQDKNKDNRVMVIEGIFRLAIRGRGRWKSVTLR